ncbi:S8 family serine peptidase [Pedobacter sp. BS3]|uniref:S8 family peptidase n=1 Tax=Pedobacter sp. BS3 TaxID=2567937 RepID=UPI0011EC1F2E|nr:S8 family peptidase [Pedobacter sp. BS3]TZF82984.1 S8 family serine peptidase [Pedobacter sp. BS3]
MILYRRLLLLFLLIYSPFISRSQSNDSPKPNWQNLDLSQDGVFGISTEKAYETLLKGKKSKTVIVAVIDGGVDVNHEDLKNMIWVNPKEVANDGKDNDKNGYIDDIHGWNFIGSAKGDVHYDNLEMTRLVRKLQPKYASVLNSTPLTPEERKEFGEYKKIVTEYMDKLQNAQLGEANISALKKYSDEIKAKIGKDEPTLADFEAYTPANDLQSKALKVIKSSLKKDPSYKKFEEDLNDAYKYYTAEVNYHLNMDFDPRDAVGDNYDDKLERYYGNNDVKGPDAMHGTHVAGIIGAVRTNNIGIKGVADNVKIMCVRTVPDGDERDKDVANAIRYAVDNGAKVINMSFGKSYSPDKAVVDSAVKYAVSKDVLLVHAAGNDTKNTDKESNYPNRNYLDTAGVVKGTVNDWIEVGASSWKNDDSLVAGFSNYGKRAVDVFAPGVKINSTIPDSKYKELEGTSMASPVVAGLAALIRSYYPKLSAAQVKDIILKSVVKVDHKVKVSIDGSNQRVNFSDLCTSGGIVNAYNALLLASKTKPE